MNIHLNKKSFIIGVVLQVKRSLSRPNVMSLFVPFYNLKTKTKKIVYKQKRENIILHMHPPLKQSRAGASFFMIWPNTMSKLDIQRMLINDKRHFSQSHDSGSLQMHIMIQLWTVNRVGHRVGWEDLKNTMQERSSKWKLSSCLAIWREVLLKKKNSFKPIWLK